MSTTSVPAFHVSDKSKVAGSGSVFIQSRKSLVNSGVFSIKIDAHFNPAVEPYPAGNVVIKADLIDGSVGTFKSTSIELINSYGRSNPTVYLTGRCNADTKPGAKGCRYWIMIADNKRRQEGTPDVVGFVIHDQNGKRIAYGTGPLQSGDIQVAPK